MADSTAELVPWAFLPDFGHDCQLNPFRVPACVIPDLGPVRVRPFYSSFLVGLLGVVHVGAVLNLSACPDFRVLTQCGSKAFLGAVVGDYEV